VYLFVLSPEIEDREEVEATRVTPQWHRLYRVIISVFRFFRFFFNRDNFINHELLASCRTRKKYLKNSMRQFFLIAFSLLRCQTTS
jgi:hypothetical protein